MSVSLSTPGDFHIRPLQRGQLMVTISLKVTDFGERGIYWFLTLSHVYWER